LTRPASVPTLPAHVMSKVSLRRLLTRLTAIALSTSAVGPASAADTDVPASSQRTGDGDDEDDLELIGDVPIDADHIDPADAAAALGRGLALAVHKMRPISATHLVATWALSADPVRRLAVAHSLEWTYRLVGDGTVLDHLSHDPDPAIRAEVARAAWSRRTSASGVHGVLARLCQDPDPGVRAVAQRAR
jgi:hypothetical protein